MKPEQIAEVCHEANRALTRHVGDVPVQPPWDEEDPGIKASAINGVNFNLANPDAPPSASHDNWMKVKLEDGWKLGPAKDVAAKTHPALVPYEQLPEAVRRKDALFKNIVAALRPGALLGVLLALLLPGLAFAADAPAKTTGQVILEGVLQYVVVPLLPIVGGLLAALLAKAVAYLNARQKESVGNLLAAKLTGAAASVVAELNATLRPQLEAALADGVLTDAEKKQLKDAAMELLKTKLPADLLKATGQTFGELTDTYLGGLIERALNQEKATAAIAASRPPTP